MSTNHGINCVGWYARTHSRTQSNYEEKILARIRCEVPEQKKNAFIRITEKLETTMTKVLKDFLDKWIEDQGKTKNQSLEFVVVHLDENIYNQALAKASRRKENLNDVIRDFVQQWAD